MPADGDDSQGLAHFPFLARLEILPEWEGAARLFLERGGIAVVLGAPDTGKSALSRYLLYKTFAAGLPGALVDLDLGQSHLGPPATLGLGLFPPRLPGDNSLFPESLYFIGQTSPVGSILEVAVGCRVLVEEAARRGVTRAVVNTSGLVHGPGALRLKRAQVELLQPRFIFALQRDRELDPLLQGLGGINLNLPQELTSTPPPPVAGGWGEGEDPPAFSTSTLALHPQGGGDNQESAWTVVRLPVSSRATRKAPEDRRRYREERFRRYFQEARRLVLPWRSLVWEGLPWDRGEPLPPGELQRLDQMAGVPVLYGEASGTRKVLLVAEPPPGNLPLAPGESLHWLTWSSMHFRLVGLLDAARRTLALGLILPSSWNLEEMAFWTPLAPEAAARVHFLQVGKMRISLTGKELAYV
jgi:polynucleotide 5'-kinase involved in rRNA processing